MLDMEMGSRATASASAGPACSRSRAPALVMVGHWGLPFEVTPPGGKPFVVTLLDKAGG